MKIVTIIILFLLVLAGCGVANEIDSEVSNSSMYTQEMGTKWVEIYMQKLSELKQDEIKWIYPIEISTDTLNELIAYNYAQHKVLGYDFNIENIKEKAYERALLEDYARKNGLFPTNKEIEESFNNIISSSLNISQDYTPFLEGKLDKLNITLEDYTREFLMYDHLHFLIYFNINNKLTKEMAKTSNNNLSEDLVDNLLNSLKNN